MTGETRESRTKARIFWAKWNIPLNKNSRVRLEGMVEGIGESVPGCIIEVEESRGNPSVQNQMGRVRRKARPEQ